MRIEGKILEKLEKAGIKIEETEREVFLDDDTTEIEKVQFAKFPCGRDFQYLKFSDKIDEKTYLKSDFEQYKFIKDFEAIWSPKTKSIECEIRTLSRLGLPSRYFLRKLSRIVGVELEEKKGKNRFKFEKSDNGQIVSIGSASIEFAILTFSKDRMPRFEFAKSRPTIRIENIDVTTHDQAKRILEKVGNSLLFKLDLTNNFGFKLAQDREIRRSYLRRKKLEYDFEESFPTYEYDSEPMSLYWYAKSAIDMPLLQFLALYQILEFYFPIFSQKEAHHQIKNIIKDPRFNPNKDSDITRVLSTISQNKSGIGFGSELEQLKSTIQNCISTEEIKEIIDNDKEMEDFFKDKKSKKLASKSLTIENGQADLTIQCAERIYEIRCRVVHTKASDKNYDMLLPSSPELKNLIYDIALLETIAKKVLVATSRLLKV